MNDEIKAVVERYLKHDYLPRNGDVELDANGQPTGYLVISGLCDDDMTALAEAYIAHLDREAERALPITVEWLEPLCVSISVARRFWFLEERLHLMNEGEKFWVVLNGQPVKVTTRGQVMDLCSLIGFKLGWHLEGKVKA